MMNQIGLVHKGLRALVAAVPLGALGRNLVYDQHVLVNVPRLDLLPTDLTNLGDVPSQEVAFDLGRLLVTERAALPRTLPGILGIGDVDKAGDARLDLTVALELVALDVAPLEGLATFLAESPINVATVRIAAELGMVVPNFQIPENKREIFQILRREIMIKIFFMTKNFKIQRTYPK